MENWQFYQVQKEHYEISHNEIRHNQSAAADAFNWRFHMTIKKTIKYI